MCFSTDIEEPTVFFDGPDSEVVTEIEVENLPVVHYGFSCATWLQLKISVSTLKATLTTKPETDDLDEQRHSDSSCSAVRDGPAPPFGADFEFLINLLTNPKSALRYSFGSLES